MSTFQVTKYHPVQVGADVGRPLTITNKSGPTVEYGTKPAGTGSSLANGSSVTIETTTWFSTTSTETSELEYAVVATKTPDEPAEVAENSVGTSALKALAVTEAKIGENAVTGNKVKISGKFVATETAYTVNKIEEVKETGALLWVVYLAVTLKAEEVEYWIVQYEKGGAETGQMKFNKTGTANDKVTHTLVLANEQRWKIKTAEKGTIASATYSYVRII